MSTAKGFNCKTCGKRHLFGGWVAAHAQITLVHTCECGAKHEALNWRVDLVKAGVKPKTTGETSCYTAQN